MSPFYLFSRILIRSSISATEQAWRYVLTRYESVFASLLLIVFFWNSSMILPINRLALLAFFTRTILLNMGMGVVCNSTTCNGLDCCCFSIYAISVYRFFGLDGRKEELKEKLPPVQKNLFHLIRSQI